MGQTATKNQRSEIKENIKKSLKFALKDSLIHLLNSTAIEVRRSLINAIDKKIAKVNNGDVKSVFVNLKNKVENMSDSDIEQFIQDIAVSGADSSQKPDYYESLADVYSSAKTGGGCGCAGAFYGGDELSDQEIIRKYGDTMNSFTKDKLVDEILKVLGDFGFNASGKNREEKIKNILDAVPNTGRNKNSFVQDAEKQEKLCRKLAKVINANIGGGIKVIDETMPAGVICQSVAEIIDSLRSGMKVEFVLVHDNIRKILKNMLILREQMDKLFNPITETIESSSDMKLKTRTAKYRGVYKLLSGEMDRQIQMLRELVNVTIEPAEAKLARLIRDEEDLGGLVERIDAKPGDSQFGEVMGKLLRGVGVIAEYALLIDKALKDVGMTIDQYASASSTQQIRDHVSKVLLSKDMKDDELYNFLQEVRLLYENFYRAKDIKEVLEKAKSAGEISGGKYHQSNEQSEYGEYSEHYRGGIDDEEVSEMNVEAENYYGGEHTDETDYVSEYTHYGGENDMSAEEVSDFFGVSGGYSNKFMAETPKFPEDSFAKSPMDRRIRVRKELRNIVFETFAREVDKEMHMIIQSLNNLSEKLGGIIPLSDPLDGFRSALVKLRPILNYRNAYITLIGYYNDALTRERKDVFMNQLKLIKSYADDMVSMPEYASIAGNLRDISGNIAALLRTIDTYSDKVAQKFGSNEEQITEEEKKKIEEIKSTGETQSGPVEDYESKMEYMEKSGGSYSGGLKYDDPATLPEDVFTPKRTPISFSNMIEKFDYYYKVAQLKQNLDHSGNEFEHYSENYEKIRGEAIAKKIDEIRDWKNKKVKELDDSSSTAYRYLNEVIPGTLGLANPTEHSANVKVSTVKMIENVAKSRINLWRTVEAVDEYMRLFTADITKNYSNLEDIKTILEGVEVIHDWSNSNTGKFIHLVFDKFPAYIEGVGSVNLDRPTNLAAINPDFTVNAVDATLMPNPDVYGEAAPRGRYDHYYEPIAAEINRMYAAGPVSAKDLVSMLPGNPFIAVDADSPQYGFSGIPLMRKVMQNLMILKNLLSVFIRFGDKFGSQEINKRVFMPPRDIYDNLCNYIEVCAFGIGGFYDTAYVLDEINNPVGFVSDPFNTLSDITDPRSNVTQNTNVHPGYVAIPKNGLTYYRLSLADAAKYSKTYLINPATIKPNAALLAGEKALPAISHLEGTQYFTAMFGPTAHYTKSEYQAAGIPESDPRYIQATWKMKYGVYMRGVFDAIRGDCEEEDRMFVHIVKAMCSKILTVTGLYDIFERPNEQYTMSPVRFILGAADEYPPVNEKITALYIRLGLLGQFYKKFFDFYSYNTDMSASDFIRLQSFRPSRSEKITMMPEGYGGVFNEFINFLFMKTRRFNLNELSDPEMKEYINIVNKIADKLAPNAKNNLITYVINEFKNEINQRFGLISMKERQQYLRQFGYKYNYPEYQSWPTEPRDIELPLLPDEEPSVFERRAVSAPSARYEKRGFAEDKEYKTKNSPWNIAPEYERLVRRFRCILDAYFKKNTGMLGKTLDTTSINAADPSTSNYNIGKSEMIEAKSFKPAIKAAATELTIEKNPEKRYNIISGLLRGSNITSKVDSVKYVMFHETVVSGLNTLSAIHTVLSRFRNLVLGTDLGYFMSVLPDVIDITTATVTLNGSAPTSPGYVELGRLDANWKANVPAAGLPGRLFPNLPASAPLNTSHNALYRLLQAELLMKYYGQIDNANNPTIPITNIKYFNVEFSDVFGDNAGKKTDNWIKSFFRALSIKDIAFDLLEAIYSIGNDLPGLVSVKINPENVSINFGRLVECIQSLMSGVRYYLDVFQDIIDRNIIERYTLKERTGSLYWLQENLVDKLIVGRESFEIEAYEEMPKAYKTPYVNVDECVRILNNTLKIIRSPIGRNTSAGSMPNNVFYWGQLLARLTFYDCCLTNSGIVGTVDVGKHEAYDYPGAIVGGTPSLGIDFSKPMNKLLIQDTGSKQIIYPDYSNRYHQLYSWDPTVWNDQGSLLFTFNQLLAKYIHVCYDSSMEKIYMGVIGNIVNGPFNKNILDPHDSSYPDTVHVGSGIGTLMRIINPQNAGESDYNAVRIAAALDHKIVNNKYGASTIPVNLDGTAQGNRVFLQLWSAFIEAYPTYTDVLNAVKTDASKNQTIDEFFDRAKSDVADTLSGIINFTKMVNIARIKYGYIGATFIGNDEMYNYLTALTILSIIELEKKQNEIPRFFSDMLLKIYQTRGKSFEKSQEVTYYGEKYYNYFFKGNKATIVSTETAVAKDVPIPLSEQDQKSHNTNIPFGKRVDPHKDNIIFASLAQILKNLVTSKNSTTQMPIFIVENIAEVSAYMKESYRANLPTFRNLFKEVASKGEFIKKIINMKGVNGYRTDYTNPGTWPADMVTNDRPNGHGLACSSRANTELSQIFGRQMTTEPAMGVKVLHNFVGIINSIIQASNAVISSIDSILRELGDDPKYFETYANSIQDYKNANGYEPFMPPSDLLLILKEKSVSNKTNLLPLYSLGNNQFKYLYGTRGIYGRPHASFSADSMVGWKNLLEMYNLTNPARSQLDTKKSTEFMTNLVNILKYINGLANIKYFITPNITTSYTDIQQYNNTVFADFHGGGSISRSAYTINIGPGRAMTAIRGNRLVRSITTDSYSPTDFAYNNNPSYVLSQEGGIITAIELVESSFKDEKMEEIARYIAGHDEQKTDLEIINILDMNIVPINIHALMRGIPLANLYNYSFTFDRLIIELYYGINGDFGNALIWKLCNNDVNWKDFDGDINLGRYAVDEQEVFDTNNIGTGVSHGINFGVGQYKSLIKSPKEMFIALLLNPYRKVSGIEEYKYVTAMFRGNVNDGNLATPVFLGSQVFNKVLFGDMTNSLAYIYNYSPREDIAGADINTTDDSLIYPKVIKGRELNEERLNFNSAFVKHDVPANLKIMLKYIGKLRFNTVFIRNLMFLVNAYRSLRLKLFNDLMYNKGIIVKKHYVTRPDNTELRLFQQQKHSSDYDLLDAERGKFRGPYSGGMKREW